MGFLPKEYFEETQQYRPATSTVTVTKPKSKTQKNFEKGVGGALKIIDFIEKPFYALMGLGKDIVGGEAGVQPIKAMKAGIADRASFGDVLSEAGWQPQTMVGKIAKGTVSFVGGVAFDPITYLTFGAGKGIQMSGKVLSSVGTKTYLQNLSKVSGLSFKSMKDVGKASSKITTDMWDEAMKLTKEIAFKDPDTYFNKTALRYFGKEIPLATDALRGIGKTTSKALEPLLKTRIVKEAKFTGKRVETSLGEMFSTGYDIRHSTRLTPEQKMYALEALEKSRVKKAWQESENINEARRIFAKMNSKQRDQTVFEVEKFLKLGVKFNEYDKAIVAIKKEGEELAKTLRWSGLIKENKPIKQLLEEGDYARAYATALASKKRGLDVVQDTLTQIKKRTAESLKGKIKQDKTDIVDTLLFDNNLNKDLSAQKILDNIKDPKVKQAVIAFRKKMEEVWESEIMAGVRKVSDPIEDGYVKRVMTRGSNPQDFNNNIFAQRTFDSRTIEEIKNLYKENKIDYLFETDAAKLMVARTNESTVLKLKKELIDGLEQNGLLQKMPTNLDEINPNMVEFDFMHTKYVGFPELIREIESITPKLVDTGMKNFLSLYDNVLNAWKLSVTSVWMSFHTRNAMSNVFLGWLAGNKNPLTYKVATKVQWYAHNLKLGKEVKDELVKVGNRTFRLSEIYKLGAEHGVIGTGWLGADVIERLAISKSDPSFWLRQPQRLGTAVENNARIALFIDSLSKGDDIASATMKVKKFLFDYGDLTEFEKNVMKRIIPFYTWLRKNIPLQMEQLLKQPAKYAGVWHAQEGIEDMTPAKEELYLPPWMKGGEMYVRLPNKFYWNPDLPFQDLARLAFKDRVIRETVSSINPLLKGLFEIASNKDIFRGKPLADERLPDSKFLRAKIKQELINNLRFTNVWKRATDADRTTLSNFLDVILGINATPFDVQKGRENYLKELKGEREALRKEEREKNKKKWYEQ